MALTRKTVRAWHKARLAELEHQHDNSFLFSVDKADDEGMRSALFKDWCNLSSAPSMEIPPAHFQTSLDSR